MANRSSSCARLSCNTRLACTIPAGCLDWKRVVYAVSQSCGAMVLQVQCQEKALEEDKVGLVETCLVLHSDLPSSTAITQMSHTSASSGSCSKAAGHDCPAASAKLQSAAMWCVLWLHMRQGATMYMTVNTIA